MPAALRVAIGKTEIVKSFESGDRGVVRLRHAEFHASVERWFSEAKTEAGVSGDLLFEAAVRSLRSRGLPNSDNPDAWTVDDRDTAVDIVLTDAGIGSLDELEEALETTSSEERAKLRQVSTEVAIVQGTLGRPRPKLSYCLRLLLEDKSRGRDVNRGDWLRYKRERNRIVAELVKMIGDKEATAVTRTDARSYLTKLEGEYAPGSVRKQVAFVKALLEWSFTEFQLTARNPFEKMTVVVPEDDSELGVSFEYSEVGTLLAKVGTINDELQEIIRLLACTGARLGEICGLELQEIDTEKSTISLRFNSIGRLKNKKSIRIVPVVDQQSMQALRERGHRIASCKPAEAVRGLSRGSCGHERSRTHRHISIHLDGARAHHHR
ncbi:tyrosine-type recombinase/integrase [Tardiphaga sp.]|uniref:site-specific integrase n=1 Tax=Tardiphaga sp. TaxID=1926292 RepID=UPI002617FD2A|nr:tyrosine-type recombinase/integrase [Tardiphaga sp.]MDB5617258.1 hypothetical protein [Tardiphaga sp.]